MRGEMGLAGPEHRWSGQSLSSQDGSFLFKRYLGVNDILSILYRWFRYVIPPISEPGTREARSVREEESLSSSLELSPG
jgi:hypothetical protein